MQWTILIACLLGIPVLIIASQNVAACYFVLAGLFFIICSSTLLFIFLPKFLASRKKKDERTPIINQWSRPVKGQTAMDSKSEGVVDSNSGSGIAIVSLGRSALERENIELKNLVESLSRRLERNHETVRSDGIAAPIDEVDKEHPIANLGHIDGT